MPSTTSATPATVPRSSVDTKQRMARQLSEGYANANVAGSDRTLPLLNIGCGNQFHSSWINIDLVPADPSVMACNITNGLPFEDNTFAAVYHSHVLEHLSHTESDRLIAECYRVLRPGGILRVVVPDLEQIAACYLASIQAVDQGAPFATANHQWMQLELLDQLVRTQSGGEMGRWMAQPDLSNVDFIIRRMGDEICRARNSQGLDEATDSTRNQTKPPSNPNEPPTRASFSQRLARKLIRVLCGKAATQAWDDAQFRQRGEIHRWMYDRISLAAILSRHEFVQPHVVDCETSLIEGFASFELDAQNHHPRKPDSLFLEATKPTPSSVQNLRPTQAVVR
jgi:predicted SAM-dependent methyltransferase